MKDNMNTHWRIPIFAFLILVLAALACGGNNATPERVGQVGEDGEVTTTTADSGSEAEPTEEEAAAPAPTEEEATATPEANEATSAPETFAVGDVISAGDTVLVVLGWEDVAGDSFSQPDEGQKFIAVDLMLVNQGDDPVAVSSIMQMELRDDTAQRYTPDLLASSATGASSPEGELSPGERMRGKVGFQVPQDASGLQFVYDADFLSSGKVFVDLGAEPHVVDVPAEIAGERAQEMFEIGDIVELGDLTLVVLGWRSPAGDEISAPDPGNQFVLVDLVLVNASQSTETVSSLLQVNLKDETDQLYDVDFMASVAGNANSPEGEMVPGERIRGQIGFQVPEDVQELVFVFDADVFGEGKVFYTLPTEPATVAPPTSVPGERPLDMAAVGETVTLDNLAVTVNEVTYPAGDDFTSPDEGYQFVVLDITLANQGNETLNASSLLQMWLKDATGQLYSVDLMAAVASGGTPPEGELAPGETIRGQVGFQVPVDAQGLVFTFDRDVFAAGKAFFALP